MPASRPGRLRLFAPEVLIDLGFVAGNKCTRLDLADLTQPSGFLPFLAIWCCKASVNFLEGAVTTLNQKRNAMPETIRAGSGLMVPRDGAVQNGYLTGLHSAVWLVSVANRVMKQIRGPHLAPLDRARGGPRGIAGLTVQSRQSHATGATHFRSTSPTRQRDRKIPYSAAAQAQQSLLGGGLSGC
ncbi:hypothetical protein MPLDJ20_130011 [Mesorhizobium plurifarium]|uniref:Uncharacterized protein n=1 Tax=Mesorhizobium plurifarium TaxID=69974 RepID=A0A090ENT8_MESPL|nr:hypothetical protein MPLDJ20_130011 [Mesorhizobium plurifarium]